MRRDAPQPEEPHHTGVGNGNFVLSRHQGLRWESLVGEQGY